MDFIVVTGMSGAGKSKSMEALEDMGYFCVDNVPPQLLGKFIELSQNSSKKMAVGVDTRSREAFGDFSVELAKFRKRNLGIRVVFLDANDEVLLNRYKEHRRTHPLLNGHILTIDKAIEKERHIMESIKIDADFVLDTSHISVRQLKSALVDIFSNEENEGLMVQCMSFGFKYGIPAEPDMVFDLRFLPNPHYIDELREKTGMDKEVSDYIMQFDESKEMKKKLFDMIDFLYPLYKKEGRQRFVVAIGCTGGKHRSVAFVELLAKHLEQQNIPVVTVHRDKNKKLPA